jgi:protein gp37
MGRTKIEWTDKVWNPVTGCSKVSAGCKNCYAERQAKRFWGDRKFTDVRFHQERLEEPLRWKKPARIFVCSMGDLFHTDVKTEWIDSIIEVMEALNGTPLSCLRNGLSLWTRNLAGDGG